MVLGPSFLVPGPRWCAANTTRGSITLRWGRMTEDQGRPRTKRGPRTRNQGPRPSVEAILALEDGTWFKGAAAGADGEARGEVVVNTSMTGYHEVLTGSSYFGHSVT